MTFFCVWPSNYYKASVDHNFINVQRRPLHNEQQNNRQYTQNRKIPNNSIICWWWLIISIIFLLTVKSQWIRKSMCNKNKRGPTSTRFWVYLLLKYWIFVFCFVLFLFFGGGGYLGVVGGWVFGLQQQNVNIQLFKEAIKHSIFIIICWEQVIDRYRTDQTQPYTWVNPN